MTDILRRKEMSVVLVICSPAHGEEDDSARPQLSTDTDQAVETVSTTQPAPLPSADSRASLVHGPPREQQPGTPDFHQRLDHVARDILARGGYGRVEVAYCQRGYPSVEEAIERAITHAARQIVVMPMLTSTLHPLPCEYLGKASPNDLQQRVAAIQARHPNTNILFASPAFDHECLVDLILCKIREYEPATFQTGVLHLNDLATGETASVRELVGGSHFRSRMASLGFTPGTLVKMIQNYGHGAVIVSLRGTRVALGRGEARKVGVARRTDRKTASSLRGKS